MRISRRRRTTGLAGNIPGFAEDNRMQDQDVIREFLVESHENLSSLDRNFVELERHPKDAALLASIFGTIHTIKGTCGFLAFSNLEKITHQAENILSQVRDGQRELTRSLVSLIYERTPQHAVSRQLAAPGRRRNGVRR
jgi:two-component system chemotaxis sensor kinase CheA